MQALRLMSVMAAIRLDDKPDKIDRALITTLLDGGPLSRKRSVEFTYDSLASNTWEEVLLLHCTCNVYGLLGLCTVRDSLEYFSNCAGVTKGYPDYASAV